MKISLVSMGETLGKAPMLEHCCYSLGNELKVPSEVILFYSTLKKEGHKPSFHDGMLTSEQEILEKIKKESPDKILYYVYTPYIRKKVQFMEELSKISKLYLAAVPYYWREKIKKDFPFVEDVYYDGEKGFNLDSSNTKVDYSEFNIEPYINAYNNCNNSFPVISSKYCPYGCTYCNARSTGLSDRNLDDVRNELKYLKEIGVRKFIISGNILTINKERFKRICDIMKELDIEWEGDGRVDHMNEEIYEALEGSRGTLLFGVESADQDILNKMRKGTKIDQIITNADRLNRMNIPFRYTIMFGFPWDSYDSCRKLIELRKRVGPLNYHCNFVDSYPGQPLFEEMKELGLVDESKMDYEDFAWTKLPLAPTLHLSLEEVEKLMKRIMINGIMQKSVIKNMIKTRKITEYPTIFSKGIKLLISGKRTWKD